MEVPRTIICTWLSRQKMTFTLYALQFNDTGTLGGFAAMRHLPVVGLSSGYPDDRNQRRNRAILTGLMIQSSFAVQAQDSICIYPYI